MKQNIIKQTKPSKKKKPKFFRQQSQIFKKLDKKWRAPKGMHSKLRRKKKGKGNLPSIGYSSPKEIRGLSRGGLIPIVISEVSRLNELESKHGIIVSKTVGARKRIEILKKIKELNLNVLNVKDIDGYIKKIEEERKAKKELKQGKEEEKKKSQEEALKKSQEEKAKEVSQEEKEKSEKEEKRKILEQKK